MTTLLWPTARRRSGEADESRSRSDRPAFGAVSERPPRIGARFGNGPPTGHRASAKLWQFLQMRCHLPQIHAGWMSIKYASRRRFKAPTCRVPVLRPGSEQALCDVDGRDAS
ncbi:hypothetical protein Bcen2424_3239 [Burkholderia cenocepacia HI2424]|nr:hypothetical protein Bcen2424_3239 [Burkholderia cenocepacia HI2424]